MNKIVAWIIVIAVPLLFLLLIGLTFGLPGVLFVLAFAFIIGSIILFGFALEYLMRKRY